MRLLACLIVAPQRGYDEPAILSYAISSFCPTSADGLQAQLANSIDLAEGIQTKSMLTFSRARRTDTLKRSEARHGWANSAPRLRRDGRTSHTQSHRLVT